MAAHWSESRGNPKNWMVDPTHTEARPWRQQAMFVYGTGLAVGLQAALLHFANVGSLASAAFVLFGAAALATAAWLLWRYVLPRTTDLELRRQLVLQMLVCGAVFAALSFSFTELYMRLFHARSALAPYLGGDVLLTVTSTRIQWGPLIYAAVPVLPAVLLCVVGYHLHWSRILLFQSRERELRELATEAQLAALRAQINPHFFFNSLNSIAQLISVDPDKAETCVERLADIFRYMLRRSEDEFVTLAEELEIADAYLEIETARFGDSLRVLRDVDERARDVTMPGLLLQPLVENAVKHGIARKIGGGAVSVEAKLVGGELVLRVGDTGTGMSAPGDPGDNGRGVGLRNVRDRLLKHYGAAYLPAIETSPDNGTVVTIRIPASPAQRDAR